MLNFFRTYVAKNIIAKYATANDRKHTLYQ